MFRNFKVTVVVRTLVRIGCKRTEVRYIEKAAEGSLIKKKGRKI